MTKSTREKIAAEVLAEAACAAEAWPDHNSAHETLGVLLEEVEEFKREVFKKQRERSPAAMRRELIQIAACALRGAEMLDDNETWVRR